MERLIPLWDHLRSYLGMVALLIPATIFGMRMGIAVLFHEGSTLLVVANALRLLAFRDNPSRTPPEAP